MAFLECKALYLHLVLTSVHIIIGSRAVIIVVIIQMSKRSSSYCCLKSCLCERQLVNSIAASPTLLSTTRKILAHICCKGTACSDLSYHFEDRVSLKNGLDFRLLFIFISCSFLCFSTRGDGASHRLQITAELSLSHAITNTLVIAELLLRQLVFQAALTALVSASAAADPPQLLSPEPLPPPPTPPSLRLSESSSLTSSTSSILVFLKGLGAGLHSTSNIPPISSEE